MLEGLRVRHGAGHADPLGKRQVGIWLRGASLPRTLYVLTLCPNREQSRATQWELT